MPDLSTMKPILLLAALGLVAGCADSGPDSSQEPDERPNFLIILVDDMGYTDLGSFGGEIETPNLDRLAHDGLRFSNFYAAPMCSPSRAMLLTGVDAHPAGLGNMREELSPNQKDQPGYEGYLSDRVVTVSELLDDAGYRNYVTGKWHLGTEESAAPWMRGFDRSFVLDSGGASHYPDMRPAYAPSPDIKANYYEGDQKLAALPDEYEYSSQYIVDRMIDYFEDDADSNEPFFAYLAFTAPHWPIQAPDEAIARQAGRYDAGYDVLAEQRLERQIALGLIPETARRSARSPKEMPWEELDADQKKVEIRAMEIYAAMVDEMDRHTGRLLDYLETEGELDNTFILFMSDNGAEGHDLDETWPADAFPAIRKTIDESFDFSYEQMGKMGSYTFQGPNWANASSPAYFLHKGFPTAGGIRVPAFVNYSGEIAIPGVSNHLVSITDVMPTILELAGVEHPGTAYSGREVVAPAGVSFLPVLDGGVAGDLDRVLALELMGKRMVQKGDWKIVHMPSPWGLDKWQLFNIVDDIAEANDRSAEHPEIVEELLTEWASYAEENGVIIPDWVSGY